MQIESQKLQIFAAFVGIFIFCFNSQCDCKKIWKAFVLKTWRYWTPFLQVCTPLQHTLSKKLFPTKITSKTNIEKNHSSFRKAGDLFVMWFSNQSALRPKTVRNAHSARPKQIKSPDPKEKNNLKLHQTFILILLPQLSRRAPTLNQYCFSSSAKLSTIDSERISNYPNTAFRNTLEPATVSCRSIPLSMASAGSCR